jgi:hypothetical protein
MEASETGWGYGVWVTTWHEGRHPEVRAEIDELVENIAGLIEARVPDAKVSKGAGRIAMPF